MNDHSPAPWKFRGSTLYDANGVALYREMANTLTIAQDDANRRLIEASPALASALRNLLQDMKDTGCIDHYRADLGGMGVGGAVTDAIIALKAATGEEFQEK